LHIPNFCTFYNRQLKLALAPACLLPCLLACLHACFTLGSKIRVSGRLHPSNILNCWRSSRHHYLNICCISSRHHSTSTVNDDGSKEEEEPSKGKGEEPFATSTSFYSSITTASFSRYEISSCVKCHSSNVTF